MLKIQIFTCSFEIITHNGGISGTLEEEEEEEDFDGDIFLSSLGIFSESSSTAGAGGDGVLVRCHS